MDETLGANRSTMVRTRFAPSPTGDLHLGGAWVAVASRAIARGAGGRFVVRVEDLDTPRVLAGSEVRILEDLRWLGLTWDEGPDVGGPAAPYRQSERTALYEVALATLAARGLTYPCDCSRSEIASVASAPHPGEEAVYPGTCRNKDPARPFRRAPATRMRCEGIVRFEDGIAGPFTQDLAREVGDFVLRRGDGTFAYQLAVAVDDLAMGITDVVRGADLLSSTPRQIHLLSSLGARAPRYWHVPMVVASDGERLSKRTPGASVRGLREAGVPAQTIVDRLESALGAYAEGEGRVAWPRDPWPVPAEWAQKT